MKEFMVTCDLPEQLDETFMSLIPEQRAMVNTFFQKGVFTSYTLSMDRSKLWILLLADNEEQAMEFLAELPLMPYMRVELFPLAFHNAARVVLPAVSLN